MEKDLTKRLANLAQLDIDAYHAYSQAIERIEEPTVRENMVRFRDDHREHYLELAREIRGMGGTPPDITADFKGHLIEGFTAITSITGTKGAMRAMQGNEKLTNRRYAEATEWMDASNEIRNIVKRNYQDEQRHLRYIEDTLKTLK